MSYNLLDEPWIPVLGTNGKPCRKGIRDALTQAGRIRQIAASNPMDNVALLRLLIAVLHWCKPNADEEEIAKLQRPGATALPEEWLTKLDCESARFDLLGTDAGFYQNHKAWTEVEQKTKTGKAKAGGDQAGVRPVTDLLQELPSGTNTAHFRHTRDMRDGLCPACCAIGLVRLPAFATSGKHGKERQKPAGINGPTPVYGVTSGASLLDTLLLNWPLDGVGDDEPSWGATEPTKSNLGPLRAFTWQPRTVWLERPEAEQPEGTCCSCGRRSHLIYRIAFLPGWDRPFKNRPWPDDPHVLSIHRPPAKEKGQPKTEPVAFPGPLRGAQAHAASWRQTYRASLQRLAAATGQADPTAIVCSGPAANKALYQDAATQSWQFPPLGVGKDQVDSALQELDWLDRLRLGPMLLNALPVRNAKQRPEVKSTVSDAAAGTERLLRKRFEELFRALGGEDPDEAVRRWRKGVRTDCERKLKEACAAIVVGSPLRLREAMSGVERVMEEGGES